MCVHVCVSGEARDLLGLLGAADLSSLCTGCICPKSEIPQQRPPSSGSRWALRVPQDPIDDAMGGPVTPDNPLMGKCFHGPHTPGERCVPRSSTNILEVVLNPP